MKIVFEETEKQVGNDCLLTTYHYVVEVNSETYIANRVVYYQGCWGTFVENAQCSAYISLEDAINYLNSFKVRKELE